MMYSGQIGESVSASRGSHIVYFHVVDMYFLIEQVVLV